MEQKTKISSKAEFNLFKMVMYGVLFCAVGILLNLTGSRVASYFKLPLYLDSIGTVLVAVTTGLLPGVIVGFLSNVINALSDPINAYYALTSVFIAAAATWWAGKGWFNKFSQAIVCMVLISDRDLQHLFPCISLSRGTVPCSFRSYCLTCCTMCRTR